MRKKTGNIIIKVVSAILILALLGAGIALIYRYTNGFNEDFKTFYLEYNGEKILQSESEFSFTHGTEATFRVGYTFDVGEKSREYSVKVVPNEAESFDYTVGDRYMRWRAKDETADLSEYFGLKKEADSFTLSFPAEMTVEMMLSSFYPDQEIQVSDTETLIKKALFCLEVTSYNGKVTYTVLFSVTQPTVELDRDHIIFNGD